jgi:hypothetical protein
MGATVAARIERVSARVRAQLWALGFPASRLPGFPACRTFRAGLIPFCAREYKSASDTPAPAPFRLMSLAGGVIVLILTSLGRDQRRAEL